MKFPAKYLFLLFVILLPIHLLGQGYNFVGDSSPLGGDCYVVTPSQEWQNGAIWYNEAINISEPFNLQFTANFGSLDDNGADGMVFVMQQVGNNIVGEDGGGMGFGGFEPSLGVEFDTYQNFDLNDPPFDHMAIIRDGNVNHVNVDNLAGPVPISAISDNVEDGEDYIVDISWNPANSQFSVSINCEVRLTLGINLGFQVFSQNAEVFWGFTGATGGEWNLQTVCLDPYILGLPETFEICTGELVQLEAPAASLGTVSWEPAEFLDDPNSFSPIADVEETTVFTLTYEDLCGNAQTDETTVVVQNPSINLGPDVSECDIFEITPEGNYSEIIWSDGSTGESLEVTSSGVFWADAFFGNCEVSDTIEVVLNEAPFYEGATGAGLCEGEEFVFDLGNNDADILWFDGSQESIRVFSETGSYSFELTQGVCTEEFFIDLDVTDDPNFDLGPDISDCNSENIVISPTGSFEEITWSDGSQANTLPVSESGIYWADIIQGFCEASDTIEVFLDSPPIYSGETEISLCEGEEFLFELGDSNTSILWFDGSNEEVRIFDDAGNYAFDLIDGECTSTFELDIVVTDIPVFSLGPDFELCEGAQALLVVDGVEGIITWNDGSAGTSFEVSNGGNYWADVNNNGCLFSDSVEVTTIAAPELEIMGTDSLCPNETGSLIAQSTAQVVWSTGDTSSEITISQAGVYTAIAQNEDGCASEEDFRVIGLSLPFIQEISDLVKCKGEDLVLSPRSSDDFNLAWSNGEIGNRVRISEPGEYNVELSNQCGTSIQNFSISEEECFDTYYIPSAFSPDGNGINDIFKVVVSDVEKFELLIFNRYGEIVFESNDPDFGWNGSNQNGSHFCPAGLYVVRYIIDFGNLDIREGSGHVSLIR